METVSVSEFKATCLALLDKVKRTGRPILVTRRGEPIAQVVTPPNRELPRSWLGSSLLGGGTTWAIGSPRLVTRMGRPVRFTLSKSARQVALNLDTGTVSMPRLYYG